jgi:hypothetical protein
VTDEGCGGTSKHQCYFSEPSVRVKHGEASNVNIDASRSVSKNCQHGRRADKAPALVVQRRLVSSTVVRSSPVRFGVNLQHTSSCATTMMSAAPAHVVRQICAEMIAK